VAGGALYVSTELTPAQLKQKLDAKEPVVLVDVRQDWETRLCRLDNAVHIPIEEIELRGDELNPSDEIVVYCHQGVRSAAVAEYLRSLGFANVKNLAGGLDAWARSVDPSMRRY
jgi:sulfur-carrier protein adenylyltransferase/sulfurtransferase